MKVLVAYLSYSGNTEEIAETIQEMLEFDGNEVDMYRIEVDPLVDVSKYDKIFLGTFTWDLGRTPDEMKDFVYDIGYKPSNVAVFGSGDTQFGGDDLFCRAVDRLVKFYESPWEGLKVEQSPRGSQEIIVEDWVCKVVGKDLRVRIAS